MALKIGCNQSRKICLLLAVFLTFANGGLIVEETNSIHPNSPEEYFLRKSNNSDIFTSMLIESLKDLEEELLGYVNKSLNVDSYEIISGVTIDKVNVTDTGNDTVARSRRNIEDKLNKAIDDFIKTRVVHVNLPGTARTFGLKKLLVPLFIGAQIVKSILIALFLPSILGGLGRLVGKGLSSFSGASLGSTQGGQQMMLDGFDFKDTMGYNADTQQQGEENQEFASESDTGYTYTKMQSNLMGVNGIKNAMSRYGPGGQKVTYVPQQSEFYYSRKPSKPNLDFKVFHKIPASSLLLTSYDPFYSPLLSRVDAIFQQMGYTNEKCREKLVCLMYANPAKYAPYSNLISAQLSKELNELRKPSSDNPDILRFFKYMKAAKDGQDGGPDCPLHKGCPELNANQGTPPAMLTTYNDINKLVHARMLA